MRGTYEFIGEDGSMGYKKGHVYRLDVVQVRGLVWAVPVGWKSKVGWGRPSIPYRNLGGLAKHWRLIGGV